MRRLIAFAGAVGLALIIASPVAADKPSYGCGPGSDLGDLTFDQFVALPRIQAGFDAGEYTEADIRGALSSLDKNGNGMTCAQLPTGYVNRSDSSPHANYYYNAVDDNTAKR